MRKIIYLAFLFCLQTISSTGQSNNYNNIGDSLHKAEKFDDLINLFKTELKTESNNDTILKWIGHAYHAKKDYSESEIYYTKSLEINKNCNPCYSHLAIGYANQKKLDKAIQVINKGLSVINDNAELYYLRGQIRLLQKNKVLALFDFNKAIDLKPKVSAYYKKRGDYYSSTTFKRSAIMDYTKAFELDSTNHSALFARSNIYYDQNNLDKAFEDINRALSIDPNNTSCLNGRGAIYSKRKQHRLAVNDYSKVLLLSNNSYFTLLNRGRSFYNLELLDSSCIDFKTLQNLVDSGVKLNQDMVNEISSHWNDICDSKKASFYYQRGIAQFNLGHYDKAILVYRKGLSLFPKHAMSYFFLGNALLANLNFNEATINYDVAIELKEEHIINLKESRNFGSLPPQVQNDMILRSIAQLHRKKAMSLHGANKFKKAVQEMEIALETCPPKGTGITKDLLMVDLGLLYLDQGKIEKAISYFTKSIEINYLNSNAYLQRAIAQAMKKDHRTTSLVFSIKQDNQPIALKSNNFDFNPTNQKKLLSALADCDISISLDPKNGSAYYVRSKLKKLLNKDFCDDVQLAKEYEFLLLEEEKKECSL